MTTGYQIKDQQAVYYLTLQVVNWVDIFSRKIYRDILTESLTYCQENKGLELFAYVIMSNHVHLIVRAENANLSAVIRDLKSFTSKEIIKAIQEHPESRKEWLLNQFAYAASKHKRNEQYQLWTHENHAIVLYSSSFFKEKLNYIHENPVRSGIVERAEEYIYSSAKNYAGEKGIINITVIDYAMLGLDKAY